MLGFICMKAANWWLEAKKPWSQKKSLRKHGTLQMCNYGKINSNPNNWALAQMPTWLTHQINQSNANLAMDHANSLASMLACRLDTGMEIGHNLCKGSPPNQVTTLNPSKDHCTAK